MQHLGDFAPGQTIRFLWSSNAASGASITRSTNGTISVYKDGGVTQTTTGVTDTEDFDALTGIHLCEIATTDSFYAAGSSFDVVLSAATIDTQVVNAVLGSFTIGRAGRMGRGTAQSGTASTIVLAAASAFGDDIPNGWLVVVVSGTGVGQARIISDYVTATDTATISPAWTTNPDSTSVYELFAGVPGFTSTEIATAVADQVWEEASTDHQTAGSTGNKVHTLGDDAGAGIAAVLVDTGTTLDARIPAALVGGRMDSSVGTMAANTMTAAAAAADLTTELQSGLATAANLATVAGYIDTEIADIQTRLPAALVGGRMDSTVDGTGMEAGAIAAILTTQMTEAYAADGAAPTLAQALFIIQQALTEFSVSGVTQTIKKLDGSTTAATLTLAPDATDPTSITRAT